MTTPAVRKKKFQLCHKKCLNVAHKATAPAVTCVCAIVNKICRVGRREVRFLLWLLLYAGVVNSCLVYCTLRACFLLFWCPVLHEIRDVRDTCVFFVILPFVFIFSWFGVSLLIVNSFVLFVFFVVWIHQVQRRLLGRAVLVRKGSPIRACASGIWCRFRGSDVRGAGSTHQRLVHGIKSPRRRGNSLHVERRHGASCWRHVQGTRRNTKRTFSSHDMIDALVVRLHNIISLMTHFSCCSAS